jgi:hypothetical protein
MALLALLVVLTHGTISVPPGDWKAIELNVPEQETVITGSFSVLAGGDRVQAVILERSQAERFHRGRAIRPLYVSGFRETGRFRYKVREAGDYVVLLDNRLEGRTATQVEIRLELSSAHNITARTLSPERRKAVVALSLMFFGAVVVFSARQFLKQ